jgi:FkbM family methyltransferase
MINKNHNAETVNQWFSDNGDVVHRLNYPLNQDSVVFDIGGFQGNFADQIHGKFNATVHVFEPMKQFSNYIGSRFAGNDKVLVYPVGVGAETKKLTIYVPNGQDEATLHPGESSIAREEEILVVDIVEVFEKIGVDHVNLMKLNIEGAEFDLLERLLDTNLHKKVTDIQIQYHIVDEDSEARRESISERLSETHERNWNYPWVWENWKIK